MPRGSVRPVQNVEKHIYENDYAIFGCRRLGLVSIFRSSPVSKAHQGHKAQSSILLILRARVFRRGVSSFMTFSAALKMYQGLGQACQLAAGSNLKWFSASILSARSHFRWTTMVRPVVVVGLKTFTFSHCLLLSFWCHHYHHKQQPAVPLRSNNHWRLLNSG